MKFEWEEVTDSVISDRELPYYEETERVKVIGGWIVKTVISYGFASVGDDWEYRSLSKVFIPDPNHEWEIDE